MNAGNLKSLMILVIPFVACTSQNTYEEPVFFVTPEQQQQLEVIYYEVERHASKLPRIRAGANSTTRINSGSVAALLLSYDRDIQAVLNAEQWATYDELQRDYWVHRIVRRLGRNRSGSVGFSGGANTNVGIWSGSPGDFNWRAQWP